MDNIIDCKNEVILQGKILNEPRLSHKKYNQEFYTFDLKVMRFSGACDILPIVVPKYMCQAYDLHAGKMIALNGQFRSFNQNFDGVKSKLILSVFAKDINEYDGTENSNVIEAAGFICKEPIFRRTPFGREVTDTLLAINRKIVGKADYIPCIAWGKDARLLSKMVVSNFIQFSGRIQSRDYVKTLEDGTKEDRTAYEVSINRIITIK